MNNENKLSPVTVFVPVTPKLSEQQLAKKAEGISYITGETLEKQSRYVFDRDGLEKLLGEAFDAGIRFQAAGTEFSSPDDEFVPFDSFIQSLFK